MNGKVVLDTSGVIAYLKKDQALREKVKEYETLCLPLVALGELYFGAYKAPNTEKVLRQTSAFLEHTMLMEMDPETTEHYGKIKAALEKAGTPIPDNDIWIGAVAKQHELPLLARDQHFTYIQGLKLLAW